MKRILDHSRGGFRVIIKKWIFGEVQCPVPENVSAVYSANVKILVNGVIVMQVFVTFLIPMLYVIISVYI